MARPRKTPSFDRFPIRTRLLPSDVYRFNRLAEARNVTGTQLCRDAILFFLENYDKKLSDADQEPHARELRRQWVLARGILAQIAIDIRTLLLLESGNYEIEDLEDCVAKATKQVDAGISEREQAMRRRLG